MDTATEQSTPHSPSPTMVGTKGNPMPELSALLEDSWAACPASAKSMRTVNPIRKIVDPIVASWSSKSHEKAPISLALGDPTSSTSLTVCPVAIEAVKRALESPGHAAGYVNALGKPEARQAIADHYAMAWNQTSLSFDHVVIANGCSGALELALTALLDPGSILLVPQPGFPLYQVIAKSHGATVLHYRLDPDREWEIDLTHLRSLLRNKKNAPKIRGIVVNHPSNPTGAVYSNDHLEEIVSLCEEYRLPIVADEVYGNLVLDNSPFRSVAQASSGRVPVIVASGLAKQFLLPGWRVGWIIFCDSHDRALQRVEEGAKRLAQVVLGASHLAQCAVAPLLAASDKELEEWKLGLCSTLSHQAQVLCRALTDDCLTVLEPKGAMYTMVRIDFNKLDDAVVSDDVSFSQQLLEEENLFVLPGKAFGAHGGFVRLVFCAAEDIILDAANRINSFCARHHKSGDCQ